MIDAATRRRVRTRAANQCEYCRVPQEAMPAVVLHIEHIIPRQHGGGDELSNLALACYHCNRYKGPNLAGLDPLTGRLVPLFNPRTDTWDEHFARVGLDIEGLTPTGRTTVLVLAMNSDDQRDLREALEQL